MDDALFLGRLELVSGAGRRPRLFYSVPKFSERFDLWFNLNGAMEGLDETDDGLFGTRSAANDTLLGRVEQIMRGGRAGVPGELPSVT